MSKFKLIDEGFDKTKYDIKQKLHYLEGERKDARESARYYAKLHREYQAKLTRMRNKKRRLERQYAKVEELQASINPIPPKLRAKSGKISK